MCTASPAISIPPRSGTLVTIDELTLMHHNHLKPIVYITYSSFIVLYIVWGMTACIHHCSIQSIFSALKIVCALPSPNFWQPLIFLLSPFPECRIVGIIQYVAFSDWFLSPRNMHLSFHHVFSWLHTFFLLELNILLSGCTTVYLPIYLLKDILVAFRFWQL